MPFERLRQKLQYLVMALCLLGPAPGQSRGDLTALCRDAAAEAAAKTGVPYEVLLAVSTVETGRDDRPWPWTVNFGGKGKWYDSAVEAANSVDQALGEGDTNIDLGCFQLNYRWHAAAFQSIDEMLDPSRNAIYAAGYLAQHYAKTGDWTLAAAAYHSATPEYARAYQGKFEATLARLASGRDPDKRSASERRNGFPLLIAGTTGLNGSLFPSASGGRPMIGGP